MGAGPYGIALDLPGAALPPVAAAPDGEGEGGDGSGGPAGGRDAGAAVPVFRVLLVEDDAVDARLIRACASAIGGMRLEWEVVTSVADARACLARRTFDLCITDFWLGFESSLGFLAGLSAPGSAVPAIVLTSLSTPEIRRLCLLAGAVSVVGKENLSPDTLESAVAEAMNEGGRAAAAAGAGAAEEPGRGFLDRFVRVMQPSGEAPPAGSGRAPDRDARALQGPARAFAALSETARLAVLEQVVAIREARGAPRSEAADLVAAVAAACSLVEALGRPIAFDRCAGPMRSGAHEPALIFLAYELIRRVGEIAPGRSMIGVELRREDGICALHVAGSIYGTLPALPVFGVLFTSILRRCHGAVEAVHDPGRAITLIARFPDDLDPSNTSRSH